MQIERVELQSVLDTGASFPMAQVPVAAGQEAVNRSQRLAYACEWGFGLQSGRKALPQICHSRQSLVISQVEYVPLEPAQRR